MKRIGIWLLTAGLVQAAGVEGVWEKGKIRLSWEAVPEADGYRVYRMADGKEEPAGKPGLPAMEIDAPERFAMWTLEVRWHDGKEEKLIGRRTVGSFPSYFKVGEFTLDCFGRDTWRFDEDKNYEGHKGDLAIVSSQGGASILKIRGRYGIAAGTPGGFGKIEAPRRAALANGLPEGEIEVRETVPESLAFRVKSGEGGFVHVRVKEMKTPRVTFEYVYVMIPETAEIVKELEEKAGGPLAEKDRVSLIEWLDGLTSEDPARRLKAEESILGLGAAAAKELGKYSEEHPTAETREKIRALIRRLWEKVPYDLK